MAAANAESPFVGTGHHARTHGIPVAVLGLSLGTFLLVSYLLCLLGFYLDRSFGWSLPIAHGAVTTLLPGFAFDSWSRFFLGAVESFAWGWYIALVFGPLYNFFANRPHGERP